MGGTTDSNGPKASNKTNKISTNILNGDIQKIIEIAKAAGEEILEIYARDFEVYTKSDESPLTEADKNANQVILDGLQKYYPEIPFISEEIKQLDYSERKDWDACWLIDPLDGTKEFIKKNGEFTVNIALIAGDIDAVDRIGIGIATVPGMRF